MAYGKTKITTSQQLHYNYIHIGKEEQINNPIGFRCDVIYRRNHATFKLSYLLAAAQYVGQTETLCTETSHLR